MAILIHTVVILALFGALALFAYLDRVYRELGRVTAGPLRAHLEVFEAEVEPRLRTERVRGIISASLLARFWLVLISLETAWGILVLVPDLTQRIVEMLVVLGAEVVLGMHLIPLFLVTRTKGRWLVALAPLVRLLFWALWPLAVLLRFSVSLLHLSEEGESEGPQPEQAIEALVEAATEEGILEHDEARLIEQVVEFSDKRVREVMTPRPDVVAVSAAATLEELRRLFVETKFSRLPVFESTLDEITGIVFARDILQVPERDASRRLVRELVRPALFVPETKLGSELLKEMQRKNQQMAIVVDEYGLTAGLVTIEDLIEEIVGEIGEEDRSAAPEVIREPGGSMILRGSVSVEKMKELFAVDLPDASLGAATTLAGLLNHVAGHVPAPGEILEFGGLRFEVLEANQRKVLRLRARRRSESAAVMPRAV